MVGRESVPVSVIAKNASDELRGGFDGGVGSRGRRWRAGDGCRLCALESFSAAQFELQSPAMGSVARFAPELEGANFGETGSEPHRQVSVPHFPSITQHTDQGGVAVHARFV